MGKGVVKLKSVRLDSKIKRILFDGVTSAYFAMVIVLFAHLALSGMTLDEDWAAIHFPIAWRLSLSILFGMTFLFLIFDSKGLATLGRLLFPEVSSGVSNQALQTMASSTGKGSIQWWRWQLVVLLLTTFLVGLHMTQFSLSELLDEEGFNGAIRLFKGLLSPNLTLLPLATIKILETIFIAFIATAIAIPPSFVLGFLCAKNVVKHRFGFLNYTVLRTLLNVIRSIEPLIWAIIFSVWVGIGPFAGMLALMIHSVASLTKQYSEMVESISNGPIEGIQSTGANALQIVWFGMVPQVTLPFIAFTIYRWDINVRMATIIGLVGGGGIGTLLIKYQGQAMWPEVGCIILVIAIVVWLMDLASAYLREAIK